MSKPDCGEYGHPDACGNAACLPEQAPAEPPFDQIAARLVRMLRDDRERVPPEVRGHLFVAARYLEVLAKKDALARVKTPADLEAYVQERIRAEAPAAVQATPVPGAVWEEDGVSLIRRGTEDERCKARGSERLYRLATPTAAKDAEPDARLSCAEFNPSPSTAHTMSYGTASGSSEPAAVAALRELVEATDEYNGTIGQNGTDEENRAAIEEVTRRYFTAWAAARAALSAAPGPLAQAPDALDAKRWRKALAAYERGVLMSHDGRTGETDGYISLFLQAIHERDAAASPPPTQEQTP